MHRLWSMLTDFSGHEGGENLVCCFAILMGAGAVGVIGVAAWWLA